MWKLISSPRTGPATKKLAQEFLTMDSAPRDRSLSERRLQVYRIIEKHDKFRPVTWASATCKETCGLYRVNGKHTATLFSELPQDRLERLFVTVERYQCDTLEEVADLYSTFDSKMMSRSVSDINLSFAGCVPELAELPARNVNLAVAGINYHLIGERFQNRTQPAERAEQLLEHPEFVRWMSNLLGGTDAGGNPNKATAARKHMKRAAVVAAMFATYQKHSPSADRFWVEVRDKTGNPPSVPTRKLAEYLTINFSAVGASNRKPGWRIADREVYVKCLHAWNAWRKGEATNLQYHAKAELPDVK